ncbi:MAG: hypothetical protein ACE5E9_04410 [Nitrospinaceae bacterium]
MRRTAASLTTIFVFFGFIAIASANVVEVSPGGKAICENASWIAYNLSETQDTNIEFDIGPFAYAWKKIFKATLPPGGYETNAIAQKSIITNKGPGLISVNCQRQRYDRHDWRMDAGSGKTYQTNYHLDHVKPFTYIEPGFGMPEGTERGIAGVTGEKPESQR